MGIQGFLPADDGTQLAYTIKGDGLSTCLIPAACFLSEDLEPLANHHRLIFYDQRNRGASETITDSSRISLEHELSDMDAVRRHFGLEKINVLGWSYLGGIAMLYAARNPDYCYKLITVGAIPPRKTSNYNDEPNTQANLAKSKARVSDEGIHYIASLRVDGLHISDPALFCREYRRVYRPSNLYNLDGLSRMKNDPCQFPNEHPDHVQKHLKTLYSTFGDWDWQDEAKTIKCPTLILHGREDRLPMLGAEEWANLIPEARLIPINESAHFPWLEQPNLFFATVEDFLR